MGWYTKGHKKDAQQQQHPRKNYLPSAVHLGYNMIIFLLCVRRETYSQEVQHRTCINFNTRTNTKVNSTKERVAVAVMKSW